MKKCLAALIVAFLFTNVIYANDVPLSSRQIIDNNINEPQCVFPADIDGDADLDLIGAAAAAGTIVWWQNSNGDGSAWTQQVIDAAFAGAAAVRAVDIDDDGDLDALGAAPGEVAWWENIDTTGTSWRKHLVAAVPDAITVHAADIDQDGDYDVLGADYASGTIYWWANGDGAGTTWTAHTLSTSSAGARSLTTADVDDDGDLDVLSAAELADDISWWENVGGSGASWTEHRLHDAFDGARFVHTADMDNDGDPDVLGAAFNEDRLAWWENSTGDGTSWVAHTVTSSFGGASALFTTDFDWDGDLDVVGTAVTGNAVTWWENSSGDASTWIERSLDNAFGGANFVYGADVDSDGDTDILATAAADNIVAWWQNEMIHSRPSYPTTFTIADDVDGSVWSEMVDVDEDGDLDVLATGFFDGSVSWFENVDGVGTAWTRHIVREVTDRRHEPYMLKSGDFDRDGDPDLAGITIESSELAWYENVDGRGTTWTTHILATDLTYGLHLAVADVDSDGDVDLLTTNDLGSDKNLRWWGNQNDGAIWVEHVIGSNSSGLRPVNTVDIDKDGDVDVVSGEEYGSTVYWFENVDGSGMNWTEHIIDAAFDNSSYLDPVDLDQDGDIDILGTGWEQSQIVWWENDGTSTAWTKHIIVEFLNRSDTVRAFDVDRDGDLDVIVTSLGDSDAGEFAWWENVAGDASTWTKHLLAYGDNATSIDVADLDRDGDLDIVGAAFYDNTILWWENRGGQFTLETTATAPTTLNAGTQDDVLQVVATHNGRAGDNDAELTTFELLLEKAEGEPLNNAEANAIIADLYIYLDDGSGAFETANDTWVTAVDTLALVNGTLTVSFMDNDPLVQLSWDNANTYFVVVALDPDLATNPDRNDVNVLRVTHVTQASSTAQDRLYNTPISLLYTPNVGSQLELLGPTAVMLLDLTAHDQNHSTWVLIATLLLLLAGLYFAWAGKTGRHSL